MGIYFLWRVKVEGEQVSKKQNPPTSLFVGGFAFWTRFLGSKGKHIVRQRRLSHNMFGFPCGFPKNAVDAVGGLRPPP